MSRAFYTDGSADSSPLPPHYSPRTAAQLDQALDGALGMSARVVVPTSGGLTTGLLNDADVFVEVQSAGANDIVTLPLATAATRGRVIHLYIAGATNAELRTPALSNQTINNVDADGAAEALLVATNTYRAFQHLSNGWLLTALTNLGAVVPAIVPDA